MHNVIGKIVQERIDEVKPLMNYLDKEGNPRNKQSETYFLIDWIEGNTKYKKLTNDMIKRRKLISY